MMCHCEHKSHFDCKENKKPLNHIYGTVTDTKPYKTQYGIFNLCEKCVKAGHMGENKWNS
jgi:hypothetical protein